MFAAPRAVIHSILVQNQWQISTRLFLFLCYSSFLLRQHKICPNNYLIWFKTSLRNTKPAFEIPKTFSFHFHIQTLFTNITIFGKWPTVCWSLVKLQLSFVHCCICMPPLYSFMSKSGTELWPNVTLLEYNIHSIGCSIGAFTMVFLFSTYDKKSNRKVLRINFKDLNFNV